MSAKAKRVTIDLRDLEAACNLSFCAPLSRLLEAIKNARLDREWQELSAAVRDEIEASQRAIADGRSAMPHFDRIDRLEAKRETNLNERFPNEARQP